MTLREYFETVRTRWRLMVAGLVLGLLAAIAVTLVTPKQFAADVTVFIAPRADGGASSALDAGNLASQRIATYLEVLTSDRIEQEVAQALGPGVTPAEIGGKLTARSTQDTLLLTATVTDQSPERAAQIANLVADRFVAIVAQLESTPGVATPPAVTAQIFEPAQVPIAPVVPRPLTNLLLGGLLGLLIGTGLAIVRHRTDTSVKSREQVRSITGVPVLGSVDAERKMARTPLIVDADPSGRVAEAFRRLRTNMQFLDVDRGRTVWLVTSPTPGAGKTTTVANLAAVLADAGGRVLVIEADLRRPRIAELLGVDRAVGLTNVLVRRMPAGQAIQRVRPGLDVLSSGPLPPNPSEILGSAAMAGLLAQVRERYDVVLIDASPLSPVTDAVALARQADGVLLVVPFGRVNRDQLFTAREALDTVSAPLLGTVLTMVPANRQRRYTGDDAYLAARSDPDMAVGERPVPAPAWQRRPGDPTQTNGIPVVAPRQPMTPASGTAAIPTPGKPTNPRPSPSPLPRTPRPVPDGGEERADASDGTSPPAQ